MSAQHSSDKQHSFAVSRVLWTALDRSILGNEACVGVHAGHVNPGGWYNGGMSSLWHGSRQSSCVFGDVIVHHSMIVSRQVVCT